MGASSVLAWVPNQHDPLNQTGMSDSMVCLLLEGMRCPPWSRRSGREASTLISLLLPCSVSHFLLWTGCVLFETVTRPSELLRDDKSSSSLEALSSEDVLDFGETTFESER